MSKIMVWDIETTGFKADFAHLLAVAAKWIDDDYVYTWRIDDIEGYGDTPASYLDDKDIVEEVIEMVNEADMLVHHYGDKFDLPFLNTRALEWGLAPPGAIRTVDTCKIARSQLAMGSNRLATLAEYLNDETAQKGGLTKQEWRVAPHGDRKVMTKMLEYCIGDVMATEGIYLKLRPVMKHHPYVSVPREGVERSTQCNICGSGNTVSGGSYYTKIMHVRRRVCNDCGAQFEEGRSLVR